MRNKLVTILLIATIVLSCVGLSGKVTGEVPPSWAMEIMDNTTITGLTRDGERQEVNYLNKGAWNGGEKDAWYFLVWRWHRLSGPGWTRDLQAHIEIVRNGDNFYKMEIYHSWPTLEVTIDYPYTVVYEDPHLLVLRIEADLGK